MIYSVVANNITVLSPPSTSKIISDVIAKIPENEELGEKLVEICLVILGKAVSTTKTDMDDQLLEVVKKAHGGTESKSDAEPLGVLFIL